MHGLSGVNSIVDTVLVLAPLAFIVVYSFLAKWWNNIVGRSVVTMMGAISLTPLAKITVLLLGIPTSSSTYTIIEIVTKCVAIVGIAIVIRALVIVRGWKS